MRTKDPKARERALVLPEDDKRDRTVLVSLLGLGGEARSRAIRTVAASLDPRETPVFVTDDPDFAVLAQFRHLYEYVPPIESQRTFTTAAAWEHYLAARLRLLLDKWAPVRVVAVGTSFEAYLVGRGADQ